AALRYALAAGLGRHVRRRHADAAGGAPAVSHHRPASRLRVVPAQSQALRTLAHSRPEGEATPSPPRGSPAWPAPALRDVLRRQRAGRAAYERLIGTPRRAAAGLVERPDRGPERQAHDVAPASLDRLDRAEPIVLDAVGPRLVEPGAGRHVGIDLRTI